MTQRPTTPRVSFTEQDDSVRIITETAVDDVALEQIIDGSTYADIDDITNTKANTNETIYENYGMHTDAAKGKGTSKDMKDGVQILAKSQMVAEDAVDDVDRLPVVCAEQTIQQEEGWRDNIIYASSGADDRPII